MEAASGPTCPHCDTRERVEEVISGYWANLTNLDTDLTGRWVPVAELREALDGDSEVRTFPTEADGWVVSMGGTWLPGVYDSDATARRAAQFPDEALAPLGRIYRVDGENRPVTAADLDEIAGRMADPTADKRP